MYATVESDLSHTEIKILNLYAEGLPYRSIQRELRKTTGESYDKRMLGEKMGELKKKMDCQTQFQMGYKFAHESFTNIVDNLKNNAEAKQELIAYERFNKGKEVGFDQGRIQTEQRKIKRGLYIGFFAGMLFCFMIIYVVFNLHYLGYY